MSEKAPAQIFRELADRAGMCPAAALLDPQEASLGASLEASLGAPAGASAGVPVAGTAGDHGANPEARAAIEDRAAGQPWSLPRRQLWECVCAGPSVGGQALLECLLRASWQTGAYHALVDTARGLDPESLHDGLGERLLWVPVDGPEQTVRALDLLLRDDNFALVAADLRGLNERELKHIQPFAWYRLQRLAHQRAGGSIMLSDAPRVRCADRRILLEKPRCLADLDQPRESLLDQLEADTRSYPRGRVALAG